MSGGLLGAEHEERGGVNSCRACGDAERGRKETCSCDFDFALALGCDWERGREGATLCMRALDCGRPRGGDAGDGERESVKSIRSSGGGTERRGGMGVSSITHSASSSSEESSSAGWGGGRDLGRWGVGLVGDRERMASLAESHWVDGGNSSSEGIDSSSSVGPSVLAKPSSSGPSSPSSSSSP